MWGVRSTVGAGGVGLAVGIALGFGTYVGTLRLIGVDPRDRLVVRELATRYRARISEFGGL